MEVTHDTAKRSIVDRVIASLVWATSTVEEARAGDEPWSGDAGSAIRPIDKLVLEASLLAFVADRHLGSHPSVSDLAGAVSRRTDVSTRMYELIRWRPHLRTSLGLLWIVFDHFDCGDPKQRRLLRELWSREPAPVQPHERSPYRLLDQAWVRSQVYGEPDPVIAGAGLLPFTSLANAAGGIFMTRRDLYALTHAAMYVSDFGRWPQSTTFDSATFGAMSLSRLLVRDFDLAAELALADALIGDSPANVAQLVVRAVLNDEFDRLGHVPSPTFQIIDHENSASPDDYLRFHAYHTTFVYALMCCGLLLERIPTTWEPTLSLTKTHSYKTTFANDDQGAESEHLGARVARTVSEWMGTCTSRGVCFPWLEEGLVRATLDAYLVQAIQMDRIEDALRLLNMASVGGVSRVDERTREYLAVRASLSGENSTAEGLLAFERGPTEWQAQ